MGSKRIGVSICDEKRLVATPFKTIDVEKMSGTISQLKKIILERIIFNN